MYAFGKVVRHEQWSPAMEVLCLDHSTMTADKPMMKWSSAVTKLASHFNYGLMSELAIAYSE